MTTVTLQIPNVFFPSIKKAVSITYTEKTLVTEFQKVMAEIIRLQKLGKDTVLFALRQYCIYPSELNRLLQIDAIYDLCIENRFENVSEKDCLNEMNEMFSPENSDVFFQVRLERIQATQNECKTTSSTAFPNE